MKIGKSARELLIKSGILVLIAIVFFAGAELEPMELETHWQLQFHITDESNVGIAGVRVEVCARGKLTAFNKVFEVEPKRWNFEGVTDAHGDYRLDSRACALFVTLIKDGYLDADTNFHGTGDAADANRALHIAMHHH